MSVLPYGARKIVYTKAKQTIDNRLAGRAAKGENPSSCANKAPLGDTLLTV